MVRFPNAKINLGLFIKGKRPDGYHLLETLYVPISHFQDRLELIPKDQPGVTLKISGIELDGKPEENLCVKAYQRLSTHCGGLPGVHILLEKHIPPGAGLGGGSSDAAHTLQGINDLFELGLKIETLAEIAATLGADIPFFLYNKPLLARGIGTEFEPFPLDLPYRMELITPDIHSSTVAAYKALDYRQFDPHRQLRDILSLPIAQWKDLLTNDLEVPVFAQYPELADIKASLYEQGAVYASMSGSGSAVFGLFESSH